MNGYCCCGFSCLVVSRSFMSPWTIAHQAPLPMGFPRQKYWNELPFPFSRGSFWPRDQTGILCTAGRFFTTEPPGKLLYN